MIDFFMILTGYLGGSLSALMFLPQLYKIHHTKSANDVSYSMLFLGNFASIMILVHSILISSKPLTVSCSVSVFIRSMTFFYKYYIDHLEKAETEKDFP
jgi:uncharacterized protein with PQ loop repeat